LRKYLWRKGREWSGRLSELVICGGDEESWKMRREDEKNAGSVGEKKLGIGTGRAALAKWLVDCVGGADVWVGRMPAVSTASGKKKSA
jgi:hypothetical protein